jgi:hypothetical protein
MRSNGVKCSFAFSFAFSFAGSNAQSLGQMLNHIFLLRSHSPFKTPHRSAGFRVGVVRGSDVEYEP